jgi:hypothetical protein
MMLRRQQHTRTLAHTTRTHRWHACGCERATTAHGSHDVARRHGRRASRDDDADDDDEDDNDDDNDDDDDDDDDESRRSASP